MSPAFPTEVARKEEMKGCLFTMLCAQDVDVVIPLQFVLLSSQNISHV
jgi:hypothetical protein